MTTTRRRRSGGRPRAATARPGTGGGTVEAPPRRRRMGRGPQPRAVDAHLVRVASLLLLAPLLLLLFTTTRTGPLPAPALPPAFNAASAMQLTTELARDYPNRVPGSVG